MYGLTIQTADGPKFLRSGEIQRLIEERCGDRQDAVLELMKIEELENRLCRYANHDYDVLSAALSYAMAPPMADIAGFKVPEYRLASWTDGVRDVAVATGYVGTKFGRLLWTQGRADRELVFVWDSSRPFTPAQVPQLADSEPVQRALWSTMAPAIA